MQVHFTENKGKKWVFTEAGVRLVQVHFIKNKGRKIGLYGGLCPLNTGCPLNMGSA